MGYIKLSSISGLGASSRILKMTYKLTYENFLYLALGLISIVIIYKLVTYNLSTETEEGFDSIIKKFKKNNSSSKSSFKDIKKNNNKNNKNNNKNNKARNSSGKSKGKLTFDDIVKEAEDRDPERYTVDSLKNGFFDYIESFQKEKFKNVTGTTDEALEKFGFFKEKFFEIFK